MTKFPTLDPELADSLDAIPALDLANVASAREVNDRMSAPGLERLSYTGVDVFEISATNQGDSFDVPIRLLRPAGVNSALPVLLAIHGGGFSIGSAQQYDYFCLEVVRKLGIAVANVDYRLAPEVPFPGPLNDCYAALVHLHANSAELQIDRARIAIGGTSAGGCLAAGTALKARDEGSVPIAFQYLVSPGVDDRLDTPSMAQFVDTPVLNSRTVSLANQLYLGKDYTGPSDPNVSNYAMPARATDLTGLPPAYIVAMELDPLRDGNIEYALRLLHAGVSVELHSHPGTFHGSSELAPSAKSSIRIQRGIIEALGRGLNIEAPTR